MYRAMDIFNGFMRKLKSLSPFLFVLFLPACECDTVRSYESEGIGENCLLCSLFEILSDAGANAANKSWNTFAADLVPLVAVAAAIYIAIAVLKNVGSFSKQNAADFLTGDKKGILILMFKTAAIIALLRSNFLIDTIICPILQAGLNIGTTLSVAGATMAEVPGGLSGYDGVFTMVEETVGQFNDQIYRTIAIGEAMICNSLHGEWNPFAWYWLMLLYGFILFVFGWVLLIGISFYIVDILIRLTMAAVLLPFGVAAAISNLTSGYSKNIWNVFLNVFSSFVMLGIVLGVTLQLIDLGIGVKPDGGAGEAGRTGEQINNSLVLHKFMTDLDVLMDDNQIKQMSEALWSDGSLLLTIVCFCLITQLAANIGKLAEKVAGGGGLTSAGSQVGAAIVKPISDAGKRAGKAVGGWTMTGAKKVGVGAVRIARINKKFNTLYTNASNGISEVRGTLTGTGRQGYRAFWHKQQQPLADGPLHDVRRGKNGSVLERDFDDKHRLKNVHLKNADGSEVWQEFDDYKNKTTERILDGHGNQTFRRFNGSGHKVEESEIHADGSSVNRYYRENGVIEHEVFMDGFRQVEKFYDEKGKLITP